jgi:hypothetical protein
VQGLTDQFDLDIGDDAEVARVESGDARAHRLTNGGRVGDLIAPYVDDLLCCTSGTADEHLMKVREFLGRLAHHTVALRFPWRAYHEGRTSASEPARGEAEAFGSPGEYR